MKNVTHHFEQNFHHGHVGFWVSPLFNLSVVGFAIICVRVFEFRHWAFLVLGFASGF
jgi:hypothetical protein